MLRFQSTPITILRTIQRRSISLDIKSLQEYAKQHLELHSSIKTHDLKKFKVYNPANSEVIGELPSANDHIVNEKCKIAADMMNSWKETTPFERARYLKNMAHMMQEHRDALAHLITLESGKPNAEALGEINYAASFYELYAEEAKRIHGDMFPSPMPGQSLMAIRQPVGPAALITPWNFPAAMITRKLGPALAAGCTAVIKPSEETPYTALALCYLAEQAGIPSGVVNIVPTGREDVQIVGRSLCKNHNIRKISFTGSTNVGKWLLENSASTMKKVSLELGGNAPFIVFDDADLDIAIKALIASKFRNAGQACIASNRILVHDHIYDKFAKKLVEKVSLLKVGHGHDPQTTIGPLINAAGLSKVINHVDESKKLGAKVLIGGDIHHELNAKGGNFYLPTVLTTLEDVDYPFHVHETFGPLIPLLRFKTEAEAIKVANSTCYGLAAYVCTKDLGKAYRVSEALEFGMVGVNEGSISFPNAPFGGIKDSGLGREGGSYGLAEYMQLKYICMNYGK